MCHSLHDAAWQRATSLEKGPILDMDGSAALFATGFFPGKASRMLRSRAIPKNKGEIISTAVPCPVKPHGLPGSFVLDTGSVGVA